MIGLGYVGLPLAVEFGKIRPTIGYDIDEQRISELKNGYDKTQECDFSLLQASKKIVYSSNIDDIKQASIYIITVPTPIDNVNRPDLSALIAATKMVGSVLSPGDLIIYESTVFPGATEEVCVPLLENESGLQFNKEFFCGYSPERINPGDKVNTLVKIKKITSGSTYEIAAEVDALYSSIIKAGTYMASSIKVAEAAKVIENSQRDLNIAFVNELSVIFARLGIDTLEVLEPAGSKWNFIPYRPGLVGGHCIGVDPYYLTHKAEQVGYNPEVILAGRRINDNMALYSAKTIIKKMLQHGIDVPRAKIGVLGITFKENCPDIRNSKVVDLVQELKSWNVTVLVSDCHADPLEVQNNYGIELLNIDNFVNLDAIIIAVGHKEYRALSLEQICNFKKKNKKCIFGDLKSLFEKQFLAEAGFEVFRL